MRLSFCKVESAGSAVLTHTAAKNTRFSRARFAAGPAPGGAEFVFCRAKIIL